MGTPYRYRVHRPISPFLDGIASIFDFTGSLRRHKASQHPPDVADCLALHSDMVAVGEDFRAVIGNWEQFYAVEGDSERNGTEATIG